VNDEARDFWTQTQLLNWRRLGEDEAGNREGNARILQVFPRFEQRVLPFSNLRTHTTMRQEDKTTEEEMVARNLDASRLRTGPHLEPGPRDGALRQSE